MFVVMVVLAVRGMLMAAAMLNLYLDRAVLNVEIVLQPMRHIVLDVLTL